MLWLFLSLSARAETFTLDNGATVVGMLAEYNMRGSCQISVTGGPLSGAIVTVPCDRIVRFERDNIAPAAAPAPVAAPAAVPEPVIEEVVVEALPEPLPLAQPFDAPFATTEPAPKTEPEVVAASQPEVVAAPAPEVIEEDEGMWASAPASEPAEATAEPRPSIGGVVLPSLPNLRMLRRPSEEPVEGGEEL